MHSFRTAVTQANTEIFKMRLLDYVFSFSKSQRVFFAIS